MKKFLKVLLSIFCFVLGGAVGALGTIWYTNPDSYQIPEVVASNGSMATSHIDVQEIKNKDLSIHFLELDNKYTGDCTLIKVGNVEMLVDAGSKSSSIQHIKEYVDQYCTDGKLDYVVVTHAHEDHYAGFATNETTDSLFDIYDVGDVIDFGSVIKEVTNKTVSNKMYSNYLRELGEERLDGNTIYTPVQDYFKDTDPKPRKFELGNGTGVFVEMLYQKFYNEEAETENDYSVCFQIVYDDNYYLFTGDLEKEGEESLVDHNAVGGKNEGLLHKVAVYKAGHHGSKTSSTDKLMQVIKPKVVCVCCCAGSSEYTTKNANQFPTQEFINNVYEANPTAEIYVTTLCLDYKTNSYESFNGNIVVCANAGKARTIYFSNNTTNLKDTDWFKTNRTLPSAA